MKPPIALMGLDYIWSTLINNSFGVELLDLFYKILLGGMYGKEKKLGRKIK